MDIFKFRIIHPREYKVHNEMIGSSEKLLEDVCGVGVN